MHRKHRPPKTRRRLAAGQFELFDAREITPPNLELAWRQLPPESRETAAKLMARLLLDHGHGDRRLGPAGGRDDL